MEKALLKRLAKLVVESVKKDLKAGPFSSRARESLANSISVKFENDGFVIQSSHPGFRPLVYGRKKGPMDWLGKSSKPVPVLTKDGRLVFRFPSAKSLKSGAWVHPGSQKTTLPDVVKRNAREIVVKELKAHREKKQQTQRRKKS
jgi:hypothetical protein